MIVQPASGCGDGCRAPIGPVIGRPDWAAHPRFPEQTLLLRSHEGFRAISRDLVARAEAIADGDAPAIATLGWVFDGWMGAMGSHEHYEEHKLYRFLELRYDTTMACLVEEHEHLHRARDDVRRAISARDRRGVAGELAAHREVLLAHLAREEEVVIPMLIELEPEEWRTYYHSSIQELVKQFRRS